MKILLFLLGIVLIVVLFKKCHRIWGGFKATVEVRLPEGRTIDSVNEQTIKQIANQTIRRGLF